MKKQEKKTKKKRFKILKIFLLLILILIISIGSFVIYSGYKNGWGLSDMMATFVGHDQETLKNLDELKVLLLGVSTDTSAVLTDTIMVASYNPKTQKASLLSIPRDTFIGKSEENVTTYNKINALYQTSTDKILAAVNDLTGLNLKYYVVVDTEALIKLVDDVLEGVEFDVPIDMDYDDSSQDLHIHLKAGVQMLDGEKAENLVRFRHNNNGSSYPSEYGDNDIGRMRTQREFITQVVKQTLQIKKLFKLGNIVDIVYDYVETNLTVSIIKDYIPYAIEFNTENIQTGTLPGANKFIEKYWFFKADKTKTKELVSQMFEVNQTVDEPEEDTSANSKINIEVLNGTNTSSNLNAIMTILKGKNYKILKTGDTSNSTFTTIIANGETDKAVAEKIKETLGVGTVLTAKDTASKADITIIIGNDINK